MKIRRVAILGAGNGGITAAADLTIRGFEVSLFELPKFGKTIELLRQSGQLTLKSDEGATKVKIDLLTTDIAEAVKDAQVVMLTIPINYIEDFARVCAPVINTDQIVLIHTAACMGAARFINTARKMGINREYKIGELNTLAYGTRAFPDTGEIKLWLRVRHLYFAAYPSRHTSELIGPCQQIYDCIVPAENMWEVALTNGNPEPHCISLFNAGRIEYSKGEFYLYKEGITPHTVNIIHQICKERLALGKALGFELDDALVARLKRGYFSEGPGSLDVKFNTSPIFPNVKGPVSLESRYFTEDMANGLALYVSLGKALNVPTPASESIVILGGFLLQRDFMSESVTLEELGFGGLDAKGLNEAVA